jgi:hypothetical protein
MGVREGGEFESHWRSPGVDDLFRPLG